MVATLMILAVLICGMFVTTVAFTLEELRRERDEMREFAKRHSIFR